MRITLINYIFSLSLVPCSSYALTRWGIPDYTDISAYAVNDYRDYPDLPRSIAHKNTFIASIQGQISSKYPGVSSTVRTNRENADATWSNYTSSESDISEFVFSSGHGDYNGLMMYDDFVFAGEKKFGNWTRWVIMDACLSLNATQHTTLTSINGLDYGWFNGAHAILGNHATGWQFVIPSNVSIFSFAYVYRGRGSEDLYKYFAKNFISDNKTIWESYSSAVYFWVYQIEGLGIQPAVLRPTGYADNGQFVDFADERYANTYNGPFGYAYGSSGVQYKLTWSTMGTPQF